MRLYFGRIKQNGVLSMSISDAYALFLIRISMTCANIICNYNICPYFSKSSPDTKILEPRSSEDSPV